MKKNVISAFMLIFLSIFCFAEGQQDQAGAVQPFDPDKTYELSIGCYGDLEKAYTEVFNSEDFKAKYPNISISFQTSDFSGHHSRLITVIAAGEATNDIEALEVANIAKFVEGGGLTDLSLPPYNGIDAAGDLVEFAVSNATSTDGRMVAYPVDIAPAVLFYRKSLVDAAGVDLDNLADWDAFIAAGKKLTLDLNDDGVVDQYALPHANDVGLVPLNGGKAGWFDASGNVLEPKDKFIMAMSLVQSVRNSGIDADLGAWSGAWVQSFGNGTVATAINGCWFGGSLQTYMATETAGDWRVARLPGNSYASMGGSYLSIPEQVPANKKAAAWEVIKYLSTSPNAQLISFATIDAFPALTTVYDDPIMNEDVPFFGGQKVRQIYAEVALNIPPLLVTEYDTAAGSMWGNAVTNVLVNNVSIEDAYNSAKEEIQSLIW